MQDIKYMRLALEEAKLAFEEDEVPVGAVVTLEDEVIARAHNLREQTGDPTAHAEILALRAAAKKMGGWRLSGIRLYVSIEPCPMCAGAMVLARISALIYGASDIKWGAVESVFGVPNHPVLNHRIEITGGVLAEECRQLMQQFFAQRR
jgi:tRNA(adenine34) deaminase